MAQLTDWNSCWPRCACASVGSRRGGAAAAPGLELRPADRRALEGHEGVLEAAELGALAAVQAGLVGLEGHQRGAARDQVLLARQAGHPQAVDHVVGLQLDDHRPADRHVDLVGGLEGSDGPPLR
jgi:hypothetical protein